MGVNKKTRKFAQVKRIIGQRDTRLKKNQDTGKDAEQKKKDDDVIREVPQVSSALFFQYNTALVPPYQVLVDTNFLSHTVQKKLELLPTMMDCLYAKCIPVISDCVMSELEKLGQRYRIALRIARDERWERLKCGHKGTYADDCIVDRVMRHKIYIVATNDRDLKRRIRKIPGVPIMSVARGKYVIERLPGKYQLHYDPVKFDYLVFSCRSCPEIQIHMLLWRHGVHQHQRFSEYLTTLLGQVADDFDLPDAPEK